MELEGVTRLSRDLASASTTLSAHEARFLVDEYYQMQENRIRSNNQVSSLAENKEPHDVVNWFGSQFETLESQIKRALQKYVEADPVGQWLLEQVGIGPVIAAGLLAHIDIRKAPTAGHIWAFAGLDPTKKWEKGQKRPFNARLKVVCWKAGESFVKVSGKEERNYGHLYKERKDYEAAKNERGEYEEQAKQILASRRIGKETEAYKHYIVGKLPPGHIHARAKRWAVKLFLSHLHDVWYRHEFKTAPPLPYAIAHLNHAHMIEPLTGTKEAVDAAAK